MLWGFRPLAQDQNVIAFPLGAVAGTEVVDATAAYPLPGVGSSYGYREFFWIQGSPTKDLVYVWDNECLSFTAGFTSIGDYPTEGPSGYAWYPGQRMQEVRGANLGAGPLASSISGDGSTLLVSDFMEVQGNGTKGFALIKGL